MSGWVRPAHVVVIVPVDRRGVGGTLEPDPAVAAAGGCWGWSFVVVVVDGGGVSEGAGLAGGVGAGEGVVPWTLMCLRM